MPRVRPSPTGPAATIWVVATLAAVLACNGSSPPAHTPDPAPEFGACDPAGGALQVLSSERYRKYIPPVREALNIAIAYSAQKYGWRPATPICVHFFKSQTDLAHGLEQLAGLPPAEASTMSLFWGTTGIDAANGLDAIYINAGTVNEPTLMGRLAVHEYFHVLQSHLTLVSAPAWFQEGLAEWEMMSLLGFRYGNWFLLLQEDVRRSRDIPLASLQSWEQWQAANSQESEAFTGPYWKAAAAIMFIETIGGPDAPAVILGPARNGASTEEPFRAALAQVTGITLDDFDARLRAFISRYEWVSPTSTPWSGLHSSTPRSPSP